jgi:hypothetical protein
MTADVVGFFMDGIFAIAATLLSGVLIVAANVGRRAANGESEQREKGGGNAQDRPT